MHPDLSREATTDYLERKLNLDLILIRFHSERLLHETNLCGQERRLMPRLKRDRLERSTRSFEIARLRHRDRSSGQGSVRDCNVRPGNWVAVQALAENGPLPPRLGLCEQGRRPCWCEYWQD